MATKKVWAPMPPSQRAKQFAPFQALKGLNEAIANKERNIVPRLELTEDSIAEINKVLVSLERGILVTVAYYSEFAMDYLQLTGFVTKIDPVSKFLQIGKMTIYFADISHLWIDSN